MPELGTKRVCVECSTKYFDLKRQPIVCPKCGAIFEIATRDKSRPADAKPEKKVAQDASPGAVAEKTADDDTDVAGDAEGEPEIISLDEAEEPDASDDDDDNDDEETVIVLPDDDLVIDNDDDDDVFVKADDDDDDVSDVVVSGDDNDDT